MGFAGQDDLFRKISVKIFFKPLYRSGLSANKITGFNFLTLGLGSVILFAKGWDIVGLLTAGLMAMIDYVDGTIARAGRGSKNGAYLDTSLDWLYLMLLIGSISYHHKVLVFGYVALIALTFGNWVQYNGNVNIRLPFPFRVTHLIVFGILIGKAGLGIIAVAIVQSLRTIIMYRRSLWNISKN